MTPLETETAVALGRCTFLPASTEKRFARDMAWRAEHRADLALSEAQAAYLFALAYRFRRQMPGHLVPPAPPTRP